MNPLYTINYTIFAAFLTLIVLETGIALASILDYSGNRDRVKKYLMPLWEVNGTFAVFYIVNFEASYPTLLPIVGTLYVVPALIAVAFFLIRNAFIAYSEYVKEILNEKLYMRVYAISTLIVAFFALSVFTSSVTGAGVNLSSQSLDLAAILFNPFNIAILISVVLFSLFIVSSEFEIHRGRWLGVAGVFVGLALSMIALSVYVPQMISNIANNLLFIALFIVLLILAVVFSWMRNRYAFHLAVIWFFVSVLAFGSVEYPYIFGGALSMLSYVAAPAISNILMLTTFVFGTLLVIALLIFIYISYIKSQNTEY